MNIKELREKTGLSQSKFGMRFGIAPVNIAHWEQGISNPPAYVVNLIAETIEKDAKIAELERRLSDGQ